jgi:4-hydroxybenzoyl-CoA thioesterase
MQLISQSRKMATRHCIEIRVSFGDCDPAGSVFYPHVYAWFDRTFHEWLRRFGGHGALCRSLGIIGVGVMEAGAQFQRPLREGNVLSLSVSVEHWGRKTLRLAYEGRVDGEIVFVGTELRGLFKLSDGVIVAALVGMLRELVDDDGQDR